MADTSQYSLSLSDLIMGFLFVFILILMKFMIDYQDKKTEYEAQKTELLHPLEERTKLLEALKKDFETPKNKIDVEIDTKNGVLTLTNTGYFYPGKYELSNKGKEDFEKIKKIFKKLICYSDLKSDRKKQLLTKYSNFDKWKTHCSKEENKNKHALIDSILIEGHADSTPIGSKLKKDGIKNNLDLAIKRSQTVFLCLTEYKEATSSSEEDGNYFHLLSNQKGQPLFGVASYGNLRNKSSKDRDPATESKNRRVDFRFIMSQPEVLKNELKK